MALAPDGPRRLATWRGRLARRERGDAKERISPLGVFVNGATLPVDCFAAGWPAWLASAVAGLYDADVGAADEAVAAESWLTNVAAVLARPLDREAARRRLFVTLLRALHNCDRSGATPAIIALHERALHGDPPMVTEWRAAVASLRIQRGDEGEPDEPSSVGPTVASVMLGAHESTDCRPDASPVLAAARVESTAICVEAAAEAAAWDIAGGTPERAEHDATLTIADLCTLALSVLAGEDLGPRARPRERANAGMAAGRSARCAQREALLGALRDSAAQAVRP